MVAIEPIVDHSAQGPFADERVILHGVSWMLYEIMLAARGDAAGPKMTYREGDLELMSPSYDHECVKKAIARLIEAYSEEIGIDLVGVGSWTVRSAPRARGLEPDECYVVGPRRDRPDLALEIEWTAGGIDKLDVYLGLGMREVWIWRDHVIEVHVLRDAGYVREPASLLFPKLDLELLATLADLPSQAEAVRRLRAWARTAT